MVVANSWSATEGTVDLVSRRGLEVGAEGSGVVDAQCNSIRPRQQSACNSSERLPPASLSARVTCETLAGSGPVALLWATTYLCEH